MKLMIASDIHGSAYFCRKLMSAFEAEKPDKLLLLGDILYHGPRNDLPRDYAPKEVIAMLNPVADKILCVRGNCDAEVDEMVLNFPVLADYAEIFFGGKMIFATHGHHHNPENPPKAIDGGILLNGHTHVSDCRDCGNFVYINPGSVSIPKNGTPNGYIIADEAPLKFTWKTVDGEIYREKII